MEMNFFELSTLQLKDGKVKRSYTGGTCSAENAKGKGRWPARLHVHSQWSRDL